jgi:hypothetical protein
MKTFEQGNWSHGDTCALCKTAAEGEVILVPKAGTEDGNLSEAVQIHTKCLQERLWFYPERNMVVAMGQE